MGKTDNDAEDYARKATKSDFEEAGNKDVYHKVFSDQRPCSDETSIRTQMINLMVVTTAQLITEEWKNHIILKVELI